MKHVIAGLLAFMGMAAVAGELDLPNGQKLPQGIVVRTDANGKQEAFKVEMGKVTDDVSAKAAIDGFVKPENKLAISTSSGELDTGSSTPAWYWGWGGGYGYGYGYGYGGCGYGCGGGYYPYYNYYGYGYNYYPCYNYYWGGYGYRYYWF